MDETEYILRSTLIEKQMDIEALRDKVCRLEARVRMMEEALAVDAQPSQLRIASAQKWAYYHANKAATVATMADGDGAKDPCWRDVKRATDAAWAANLFDDN
jgi:hypothetical protein